jgi:penicillin V acylase-like amidase (Ntn superfamily)
MLKLPKICRKKYSISTANTVNVKNVGIKKLMLKNTSNKKIKKTNPNMVMGPNALIQWTLGAWTTNSPVLRFFLINRILLLPVSASIAY